MRGESLLKVIGSAERLPEQRFRELYAAHYPAISIYVRRRLVDSESEVADVVADVFAVAWRRLDVVPVPPEDRLWLYGVARRAVARHQRGTWRRIRLHARLIAESSIAPVDEAPAVDPITRRIRKAISQLSPRDQEVVRLVMWEGLSHAETAQVLDCSVNAVALRLRRAKERIRQELSESARPTPARPVLAIERKLSS
jgi:RNA polymerase sigma-70 factor (ECF subfamily)